MAPKETDHFEFMPTDVPQSLRQMLELFFDSQDADKWLTVTELPEADGRTPMQVINTPIFSVAVDPRETGFRLNLLPRLDDQMLVVALAERVHDAFASVAVAELPEPKRVLEELFDLQAKEVANRVRARLAPLVVFAHVEQDRRPRRTQVTPVTLNHDQRDMTHGIPEAVLLDAEGMKKRVADLGQTLAW